MSFATRIATLPCSLALVISAAPSAHAAESFDNCTGFIDNLPATISTQGVWCLRKNLVTSMTSGNAITIAGNNITIDCNDFKIGGLPAGPATDASGIRTVTSLNATVRGCGIRGFRYGIFMSSGGGHLVENNRLDQNYEMGIMAWGAGNVVRDNRVFDTGGRPDSTYAYALWGMAHFLDNTVHGVFAEGNNPKAVGISPVQVGEVSGNRITGLYVMGTGALTIRAFESEYAQISFHDNYAFNDGHVAGGHGILGTDTTVCSDNRMIGFEFPVSCGVKSGNLPASP
jgi:parallel beta-helix repeat protein